MLSRFTLLIKIATLCALVLIMSIPMSLIMGIINDRIYYQQVAIESVAASSSDEQLIIGPIIAIPYTETVSFYENGKPVTHNNEYIHYILPKTLDVEAKVDVSPRHIGIYQTQIYQSELQFKGSFNQQFLANLKNKSSNIELYDPYIFVVISDTRGIMQIPQMNLNQTTINFEPGIKRNGLLRGNQPSGIHIPLLIQQLENNQLDFDFSVQLQGMNRLAVVPVGQSSNYQLTANWPHPNFLGFSLPIKHQISEQGFVAKWQSSWYANNINNLFDRDVMLNSNNYQDRICGSSIMNCMPTFSTSFIEPINQYQLTERSVKYDILFTVLIFVCFFIFEILKQIKIHPVQYLLVGMALAIFYLLLLAFSEYIDFFYAYFIGAIACSLLIGFYLSAVLKSIKWSGGFTLFLLSLYACLYLVMISDGNSLIFGTILLFIILGGIMILTRNIDWYKVAKIDIKNRDDVTAKNDTIAVDSEQIDS